MRIDLGASNEGDAAVRRPLSVDDSGNVPSASTSAPDECCEEATILIATGPQQMDRLSNAVAAGLADWGVDTFALNEDGLRRGLSATPYR